jgi:hemin uptake protein HemP
MPTDQSTPDESEPDDGLSKEGQAPIIDVAEWFGENREICLELDGVRYRLRITRKNKLILQK